MKQGNQPDSRGRVSNTFSDVGAVRLEEFGSRGKLRRERFKGFQPQILWQKQPGLIKSVRFGVGIVRKS